MFLRQTLCLPVFIPKPRVESRTSDAFNNSLSSELMNEKTKGTEEDAVP